LSFPTHSAPFFPHSAEDKEAGILAAAVEIFGRYGFDRASVAVIAKAAGVATGSIYNYFDGKDHLLTEVFRRYMKIYLELQNSALALEPAGVSQLSGFCHRHFEIFSRDRQLARVFHVHWRETQATNREGLLPSLRAYYELIGKLIEDGIVAGEFAPGLNCRLASQMMVGSMDEVITAWSMSESEHDLVEQADGLAEILERAFCQVATH